MQHHRVGMYWHETFFLFCLISGALCHRIAVIGGGISGTFVTRYLADLDHACEVDSITILDPSPLGEFASVEDYSSVSNVRQGSRVSTLKFENGQIVELGAHILTDQFRLIKEMAVAGNLTITKNIIPEADMPNGVAIYNGNRDIALNSAVASTPIQNSHLWRYNTELLLLTYATKKVVERFEVLQEQINDSTNFFYQSPSAMWDSASLESYTKTSLADVCNRLWVSSGLPWWRRLLLTNQGSLRQELLAATILAIHNQDSEQVNAFSGLVSFSVNPDDFQSVEGGNVQLISSAWEQADATYLKRCPHRRGILKHELQPVSTVVGSLNGFDIFSESGSMIGEFDIVILATPFSMAKIDFLVKSHIDESVLQEMPLGGLVSNREDDILKSDHEGHVALPRKLGDSVTRPFTETVTTIVRQADLQPDYFGFNAEDIPRVIYMTALGRALEYNITSISHVSAEDGIFRVHSSHKLNRKILEPIFGSKHQVVLEKVWGGNHGGASPDHPGRAESINFLLFDGATGFRGHTKSGALYYTNAMEYSFASIEGNAMGAKAVAKLVALRLGWIKSLFNEFGMGDEL